MELFLIFYLLLLNYFVTGTHISQTKCVEYGKIMTSNETVDDAVPREFPFMVKIYANISNTKQFLNGMLISENFVLSTASELPELSKPVVMLRNLKTGATTHTVTPKTYDVIKMFVHPRFHAENLSANIKLFKLNESIKFDDSVRPVCLPPLDLSIPNDTVQIGWDDTTDTIDYIKSNVISNESCKALYESAGASKFVSDIDNGTIFCARPKKLDRQMRDRYAGSVLINADHNASEYIVGFASHSLKYDNSTTTIFVRVSAFIRWIESIVWPGETPLETTTTPTTDLSVGVINSNTSDPGIPDNGTKTTTTEPIISSGGIKSNATEPEIQDNGINSNPTKPSQSVNGIKSNTTELEKSNSKTNTNTCELDIPDKEMNTNTTKASLSAGGNKSNATEPEIPNDRTNCNTTKAEILDDGINSEATKPEIPNTGTSSNTTKPKIPECGTDSDGETNYNTTQSEVLVNGTNSTKTETGISDVITISITTPEITDGEMITNTTIVVTLIALILCVSYVVYLRKRKSRQRRKIGNNYYSCYYDKFGERSALIESNV